MGIIYKATNKIDGKAFIGFTKHWPIKNKSYESKYFHDALNEYGENNFEWFVLLTDGTRADEMRLIEEHDTYWEKGKGYNLARKGISEITRKKISEARKNQPLSDRQLRVLRENARRMKLFGHTQETKNKISKAHQGKVLSEEHRTAIRNNHASKKSSGAFYKSLEYRTKMSAAKSKRQE